MPEEQSAGDERRSLTAEQKIGFVLLLIFAALGLTLGFLQIRNTMLAPFALNSNIPASIKDKINDVDSLRYRDTDSDGLSDYDEVYTYGTSVYLFDTFGYGKSDKQVVQEGLPLCLNGGRDCADAGTSLAPTTTIALPADLANPPTDFNKILTDPSELRPLLIQAGMKKEILDKLSDQELLLMVAELMASSSISNATTTR
ncbi:MAG: hypothetical protein AAB467_01560 [Patescibacteria group bacterium]